MYNHPTQGEWSIETRKLPFECFSQKDEVVVIQSAQGVVAVCSNLNAPLLLAAPKMLEALENILRLTSVYFDGYSLSERKLIDQAKAALAAAKGEQS